MSAHRGVYEAHDGSVRNDMGSKGGGVLAKTGHKVAFFMLLTERTRWANAS